MADADGLLQVVADAARQAVLTRFTPASCIATTRVVVGVLRYFGVAARPWAVSTHLFNPAAWELREQGIPAAEWPPDAWSIGIRGDLAGQVGHLVAVTSGWRMVDASLDQAARPDKGLPPIPPFVAGLPAGMDLARTDRGLVYQVGTTRLVYMASGSRDHETSPQWRKDNPGVRACTAETIRAVRAELAGTG